MVEDPRAKLCPNCGAVLPGGAETGQAGQAPPPPPPVPGMQMQRPGQSGGSQIARALLIAVGIIVGLGVLLLLGLLILCCVIGKSGGIH